MKNYFLGILVTSMSLITSASYAKEMIFEAIPSESPGYEQAIITTEIISEGGGQIRVSLVNVTAELIHFNCVLGMTGETKVYVCGKNKKGLMIMKYNTYNSRQTASFVFKDIIKDRGTLIPAVSIRAYLK
ncbi:MAG: hypothetical protein AB7I27_02635 [Bacteriovoracaceae bacterium]